MALLAGAVILFQAPACTLTSVADVAQIVTAGGVIYLVYRVLE